MKFGKHRRVQKIKMVNYFIHTERIWHEQTWKNLLEFIKTHKCHLFLMPQSYFYQYSVLGYRGTEEQLKEILTERYTQLKELQKEYDFDVGMHVHLSLFPKELSKKEKEKELSKAFVFFADIIGRNPDSIAFGWFKYDSYLEGFSQKLGMKIMHKGFCLHDYDLPLSKFKFMECCLRDILRRIKWKIK